MGFAVVARLVATMGLVADKVRDFMRFVTIQFGPRSSFPKSLYAAVVLCYVKLVTAISVRFVVKIGGYALVSVAEHSSIDASAVQLESAMLSMEA